MSNRKRGFDDTSLDLLLDTITNAFGGILFLALLIVLLLQGTKREPEPQPEFAEVSTETLQRELRLAESKLASLHLQQEASELISSHLKDPGLGQSIEDLLELRIVRDKLRHEVSAILERISDQQQVVENLQERGENLTVSIESIEEALEAIEGELEEERKRRSIAAPFPEERRATKRHFSATIRYGRWYTERNPDGKLNSEDFAILDTSGRYITITPKPYRGAAIADGDRLSDELMAVFRSKDPSQHYVEISIWDDSFLEFQVLRDYLVEKEFEYRLIVVTKGDSVAEGFVPNPQVQ